MRRLLLAFLTVSLLTVGLLLITACQAPLIPSTLTPGSRRTSRPATATSGLPAQSPTADIDFEAVFRQLGDQLSQRSFIESDMAGDVRRALTSFLNTRAERRQSIDRQPAVIDELRNMLNLPPAGKASITIADADGDERPDVLVTIPTTGLPGFIIRHPPDGFVGYQVPRQAGTATDGPVTFQRIDDLNGDGIPEIVLTTEITGASAVNTLISVVRWDGQAFGVLLQTGLSNWAGPADWEWIQENGAEALVTTCSALGLYDHKLLAHPELTRTFRWQDGNLVLDQTTLEPPDTLREQVNVAESAFRKGQLERALAAYSQAVDDESLMQEPDTQGIAWRAYAQFRSGEIKALRGNTEVAREAMVQAQAAGPALSDLATAFLEGYSNGSAARALAAVQRVNLHERLYREEGGNLGFPMNAAGILYPGAAVTAYLNTHPDAARDSGEALTDMLRDLGLDVVGSATVDLDNSGQTEVVVVLNRTLPKEVEPAGQRQTLWLLTWDEAGWQPREIETSSSLMLTETLPVSDSSRRAVVYERPENTSPRQAAISWDGAQALRYNVSAGKELTRVPQDTDPFRCTIP